LSIELLTEKELKDFSFNFNNDNIYILVTRYGDMYKYHKRDKRSSFIHMNTSNCHASGIHDTAKDTFKSSLNELIFKFDKLSEMLHFLYKLDTNEKWKNDSKTFDYNLFILNHFI